MNEDSARQYYVKIQILNKHIEQLNNQLEEVDTKTLELQEMINTVKELSAVEAGSELLVPITNGIFMPVETTQVKKLLLNVGSETVVERTPEQAHDILVKQQEELDAFRTQLIEQQHRLEQQADKLRDEIAQAMKHDV